MAQSGSTIPHAIEGIQLHGSRKGIPPQSVREGSKIWARKTLNRAIQTRLGLLTLVGGMPGPAVVEDPYGIPGQQKGPSHVSAGSREIGESSAQSRLHRGTRL
jgi:hypothetical protein